MEIPVRADVDQASILLSAVGECMAMQHSS